MSQISISGDDTINKTDPAGLKQGYWKKYKENEGKNYLAEEGRYFNDKKTGTWKEFYGNGLLKSVLEYSDGRPHGRATMYNDKGCISESGFWKSNRFTGEYTLYYDCIDKVHFKYNFNESGKREGVQKVFYANGNLFIIGNFKNGKEDGTFNYFNYSGKLVGKSVFNEGVETEASIKNKTYGLDKLKAEGDSLEKALNTERQLLNKNVKVRKIRAKFTLSGYQTTYNKNRQITKEGYFDNSRLINGKAYIYDDQGQLLRIAIYKEGEYIEDEFNANLSEEEKSQKELFSKLKNIDEELNSMKELVSEKQKEVEQKDNQLKEQTLQNQVLEKEKQIKELLLTQQNNALKAKETESLKKELLITTLNKDKRIRDIELRSEKAENDKKAQELLLVEKQRKYQEAEIKQQKFTKKLISIGLLVSAFFLIFMIISLYRNKKASKIISDQKIEVENQKHLVEEKNREITDSINYAQRIQNSLLASSDLLNKNLHDYFIYFQPKDIVSGDFYWGTELPDKRFILVTADSTGHGVPGAIMSMLNISCLNEAIEKKYFEPSEILNQSRNSVIKTLANDGSKEGGKDGMDCSLIRFDFNNYLLTYSAANNPVWIVRTPNNELIELVPDKMPVGKHDKDSVPFSQNDFALQKGDIVYTLTDGYPDQFGGAKGKKFMYKKLKEYLVVISQKPLTEQKHLLEKQFNDWKSIAEQVDDVTIIGIKIS